MSVPASVSASVSASIRTLPARLAIDPYLVAIVATIGLASLLPARGAVATGFDHATTLMIGLLFFLYGARLSRESVLRGLSQWRLHATVLASTFVLFPLLGLDFRLLPPTLLAPQLAGGLMFLCTLPSTVQSSIAFTAIARGNVPAAVCAASGSSLIGILATPLLVGLLLRAHGGLSLHALDGIVLQLLVPFLAGQVARRWIGGFLARHPTVTGVADRGSILLIVYTAFSAAVAGGIWHRLDLRSLALLALADLALLALVLAGTTCAGRALGFSRADEITAVFCGSKKSLAAGIPMANVLFPAHAVGLVVLPLLLFHPIQLMVCATLARRYAARTGPGATRPKGHRPTMSARTEEVR